MVAVSLVISTLEVPIIMVLNHTRRFWLEAACLLTLLVMAVVNYLVDTLGHLPWIWRLEDAALLILLLVLIWLWWHRGGRRKLAEKLRGYKARAALARLVAPVPS